MKIVPTTTIPERVIADPLALAVLAATTLEDPARNQELKVFQKPTCAVFYILADHRPDDGIFWPWPPSACRHPWVTGTYDFCPQCCNWQTGILARATLNKPEEVAV